MSCLASSEKYLLDRIRTYILSSSTKLSLSYWCSQIPWEFQPRSWLTEPLRLDLTSSGLFWRLTTLAIFTRGGFASAEEIQITSLKKNHNDVAVLRFKILIARHQKRFDGIEINFTFRRTWGRRCCRRRRRRQCCFRTGRFFSLLRLLLSQLE